jgi:hypothetical protein
MLRRGLTCGRGWNQNALPVDLVEMRSHCRGAVVAAATDVVVVRTDPNGGISFHPIHTTSGSNRSTADDLQSPSKIVSTLHQRSFAAVSYGHTTRTATTTTTHPLHGTHHQQQQRRLYFTSIIEPNSPVSPQDVPGRHEDDDDDDSGSDSCDDPEEEEEVGTDVGSSVGTRKPVMERPCSLILAEEFVSVPPLGFDVTYASSSSSYSSPLQTANQRKFKSWHRSFSNLFPNQWGIAYTKWSLSDPNDFYNDACPDDSSITTTKMTFDMALSTMKNDFRTLGSLLPQPILVARGPVLSWMAQFYLESLPLAGLIMIDPIPFTTQPAYALYQSHYNANQYSGNTGTSSMILSKEYYDIIQDYNEHWDHWTLKIEAGSIPMLILSTKVSESMMMIDVDDFMGGGCGGNDNDDMDMGGGLQFSGGGANTEPKGVDETFAWREFADQTAQRHSSNRGIGSNSLTGTTADRNDTDHPRTTPLTVPVIDIDPHNIKNCSTIIYDWINDKVL